MKRTYPLFPMRRLAGGLLVALASSAAAPSETSEQSCKRNGSATIMFFALIAMLSVGAQAMGDRVDVRQSWRSFFGVVRQSEMPVPGWMQRNGS